MKKPIFLFVSLLMLATTGWANEAATDKPSFSTSQKAILTAQVVAIDHETREITLRGPEGNTATFTVSEEAQNLDQVSPGDIVLTEYVQTMSIEVLANDGSEPGAGEMMIEARAEEGATPGLTAIDAQVVSATVEEINLEENTFKLRGPSGEIKEYAARDPENLKRAEVGDIVVITFTEAVAITVEKTE